MWVSMKFKIYEPSDVSRNDSWWTNSLSLSFIRESEHLEKINMTNV